MEKIISIKSEHIQIYKEGMHLYIGKEYSVKKSQKVCKITNIDELPVKLVGTIYLIYNQDNDLYNQVIVKLNQLRKRRNGKILPLLLPNIKQPIELKTEKSLKKKFKIFFSSKFLITKREFMQRLKIYRIQISLNSDYQMVKISQPKINYLDISN